MATPTTRIENEKTQLDMDRVRAYYQTLNAENKKDFDNTVNNLNAYYASKEVKRQHKEELAKTPLGRLGTICKIGTFLCFVAIAMLGSKG